MTENLPKQNCACSGGFTCQICLKRPKQTKSKQTKSKQSEHAIQRQCVGWFRKQHPDIIITSIRNEAKYTRDTRHYGALANQAGRHAGISDLIIMRRCDDFGALFVEMKTPTGRQSPDQMKFAKYCINNGYMYALARNIDEFKQIVTDYLSMNNTP